MSTIEEQGTHIVPDSETISNKKKHRVVIAFVAAVVVIAVLGVGFVLGSSSQKVEIPVSTNPNETVVESKKESRFDHRLVGKWESSDGSYYMIIKNENTVEHNLPLNGFSGDFVIEDNEYILRKGTLETSDGYTVVIPYSDDSDNPLRRLYHFTLKEKDSLVVYSYLNKSSYSLYRQS